MKKIVGVALAAGMSAAFCGAEPKIVACWGDSVTEGMAMPAGKSYPDRLQARLGDTFRVLNSGDGGEDAVTIPVRQGAYPIRTTAKIAFAAGESKVRIGDGTDNNFRTERGEKIKLTAAMGRKIPVNDVTIGGDKYRLSMSEYRWNTATNPICYKLWLERGEVSKPVEIAAGTPAVFASAAVTPEAACEIIFMGANGGWGRDVNVLIAHYRAMIAHRGADKPYFVVVPYWGAFSAADAETFRSAFGEHAIDFRAEAIAHGLADQGISPTALDRSEIAAGRVPPSLLYRNRPDVHMNEHGYDFLAGVLFERGRKLGYW